MAEKKIQPTRPKKIWNTRQQLSRLNDSYKYVAKFFVDEGQAYNWEVKISYETDFDDKKALYIFHRIPEKDKDKFAGFTYAVYFFAIDDKYVRKRIEKLVKVKLTWTVFKFNPVYPISYLDN